jgi:hypothetical protein
VAYYLPWHPGDLQLTWQRRRAAAEAAAAVAVAW